MKDKTRNHTIKFIINSNFEKMQKHSFYDNYYSEVTNYLIKWRDFGAVEKCKSILELCQGLQIDKIADIGAGLCSILKRLNKLNFGTEYYVLEVSPSIIPFVKEKINISRLKTVYLLDTANTYFENDFFDLGILSHVLEHVTNPMELLTETLRICKYVIIEIPLENCLFLNIYWFIREKITGHKRCENTIGHVNFFNKSSIQKMILLSGGIILKDRNYFPKTYLWLLNNPFKFRIITIYEILKSIFHNLIFKITNSRLTVTHYAIIISVSDKNPRASIT